MFGLDINTVALIILAIINLINVFIVYKTYHNTNSMKDALVKSTATASHFEGREEMREEMTH